MNKKEIIYKNLLRLLRGLTTANPAFEPFLNTLNDEEKTTLIDLSESIDKQVKELKKSRQSNTVHEDFENLFTSLNDFRDEFPAFPQSRLSEILLLLQLIDGLRGSTDNIDLEDDVDTSIFSLVPIEQEIYEPNFVFHDSISLENSIVLIDITNLEKLANYFEENAVSAEIYFQLIAKLGDSTKPLSSKKYVLVRSKVSTDLRSVLGCVTLHLVKAGKVVHQPVPYDVKPNVAPHLRIMSGMPYQQFDDSLTILSEYNDQEDILDKFFRLYHVFENFMYKVRLVEIEKKVGPDVFSIRDFQRMFQKLKGSEINALTHLIKQIETLEYDPNPGGAPKLFKQFIFDELQELGNIHIPDIAKLNLLFGYLRLAKKDDEDLEYADIVTNTIGKHFAGILYAFRNSVVHNRETEFHLTHEALLNHAAIENTAQVVLEKFLIPVMEEIVFSLIISKNDIVWFQSDTLKLWQK